MRDMLIPTLATSTRPIIRLETGYTALIDTGAEIPMCQDAKILVQKYNAKKLISIESKHAPISASGHNMPGELFDIEQFKIGELIYPHMRFLVPQNAVFTTDFLFSASMFQGLVLEIDFCTHYLKITIPDGRNNIRNVAYTKDGRLHILENH